MRTKKEKPAPKKRQPRTEKEQVANQIEEKFEKEKSSTDKTFYYSTGATVFDLALGGGHPNGKIINIVGDKSTGKTLLACEIIAHAKRRLGDKLKWHYDDAEAGFSFPTKEMYGFDIVAPDEECSYTMDDFRINLNKRLTDLKDDEFFIYVLDSFDSLTTEQEVEHAKEKQKAIEKGKESKGTYGTSKAKEMSEFFRLMRQKIKHKNCLLIIISQVRENIGISFGRKYERTGGKALDFYAAQIAWLAEVEKKKAKDRTIGVCIKAQITKNKVGLPFRECYIEILFDYGVDDILSNLMFLYDLKTEKGRDKEAAAMKKIVWKGKEFSLRHLVSHIEKNNLEEELRNAVIAEWSHIEEQVSPLKTRKKRWDSS